jgi:hypothetical protein
LWRRNNVGQNLFARFAWLVLARDNVLLERSSVNPLWN